MKQIGVLYLLLAAGMMMLFAGCNRSQDAVRLSSPDDDSVRIMNLLKKGDKIYAVRGSMSGIGESLLYFDSANRMARRLQDTALLAYTLYYIGNVYNAWNGEPHKTLEYYNQSAKLFAELPAEKYRIREFYLKYLIAHGYDGEKLNDSVKCVHVIQESLQELNYLPPRIKDSMDFIPDFAWVATNVRNYSLAKSILDSLRFRPKNNPESNNYLDHYYLSKARIDVFYYKRASVYLDSLFMALKYCNNRFDSAYYVTNLAEMYSALHDYRNAYEYINLNSLILNKVKKSDILTDLRTEVLQGQLQVEKEKEFRNKEEIKIKNLYLWGAGLLLTILLLLILLYAIQRKRKLSQERISRQEEFTRLLLMKEEEERKRIAMDLHDGINHDLLSIKNNLILKKVLSPSDIDNVIASVRYISRNLYPVLFENIGLQASVESLCRNMTESGIFTTCEIEYANRLSKDEELQLYRIIQEGLQNVAKHAHAEACKITIRSNMSSLLVEIKDNGKGFHISSGKNSSFGLQSMRERAKAIHAEMVLSSHNTGTVITFKKNMA